MFGTNLVLRRTITTKLGDTAIHIHDEIENESAADSVPLMIMYHCNVGFPLLDACSRLVINPALSGERDELSRLGASVNRPSPSARLRRTIRSRCFIISSSPTRTVCAMR